MTDSHFPRSVVVHGTGLMGCSFALALKKKFPETRIFGVDSPEVLERARRLGAVENGTSPPNAELVVLASPIGAILEQLDTLESDSGLILDVGSTKVAVCRKAEQRKLRFVGGHPMTGSERFGPEAASAEIFQSAPFFLCPISTTPADALPMLKSLLQDLGAVPVVIDPKEHDNLVARLSHLPQILSTVLADHTAADRALAGPGWKSVTRLAGSPFHVWRDILQTSGALPQEIRAFSARLEAVLKALENDDLEELEAIFERANRSVGSEPPT